MILKKISFKQKSKTLVPVFLFVFFTDIFLSNIFCTTRVSDDLTLPYFVELAKSIKPSVVNIYTKKVINQEIFNPHEKNPKKFGNEDFFNRFFKGMPEKEFKRKSLGSGLILNRDGYIITSYHVIENTSEIKVSLFGMKEYECKVIGKDTKTDLALIKIEPNENLKVPNLADSDKLEVGEWVMAIGNPFGFEQTVTVGIVSAKGRVIGVGPYDDFIQTDASINPGNSGGPLINTKGEVVGINSLILSNVQGLGFAIPINMVKDIVAQLIEKGKVTRGWLGVVVQKITPEFSDFFKLPNLKGALVSEVIKDGPAYKAGIEHGDVIIKFHGKDINDMNELPRIVALTPVGRRAEVRLIRKGREKILNVKVEELVDEKLSFSEKEEGIKNYGMIVEELTANEAQKFSASEGGIFITEVINGSLAEEAGVLKGDQIIEVNKIVIKDIKDYNRAIRNEIEKGIVLVLVKRKGDTLYIAIKIKDYLNRGR